MLQIIKKLEKEETTEFIKFWIVELLKIISFLLLSIVTSHENKIPPSSECRSALTLRIRSLLFTNHYSGSQQGSPAVCPQATHNASF